MRLDGARPNRNEHWREGGGQKKRKNRSATLFPYSIFVSWPTKRGTDTTKKGGGKNLAEALERFPLLDLDTFSSSSSSSSSCGWLH